MMKNRVTKNFLTILSMVFFASIFSNAQSRFTCVPSTTSVADTLGSEMVFYFDVTNNSSTDLTLFIARTQNDLPADWQSSLCFTLCYPPVFDTIITNSQFQSSPIPPDSTMEVSLHVFTMTNEGTANLHLVLGDYDNLSDTVGYNLTATTVLTGVNNKSLKPQKYFLSQNFPNPFNPSTIINYSLEKSGYVTLKVYNVLGKEVNTLVDAYKSAGQHKISFNASSLPSGIYFYRLETKNYHDVKKMILIK